MDRTDRSTGNLTSKAGMTLGYTDASHTHAVTSADGNTYSYDANGNMTQRVIGGNTYNLSYDAENRLVSVSGPSLSATFTYDGDGNRVQSTIGSTTTTFVGNYYEVSGSTITKYYYAGSSRVAMSVGGTVSYLLSDQLGSTSITTDSSGVKVAELRYDAWGSVRYTSGTTPTKYTYTGQYSNVSDFGLMFYNARWYDVALGRFASADTIVPDGVQGYDRYAYANNSPVLYNDPSGHCVNGDIECRDELRETEKKYHVSINDKGGHWTTKGLSEIHEGLERLRDALGGARFENLFGGVKFSTYSVPGSAGGCKYARDLCTAGNNVRVDVAVMDNRDNYVEYSTVHEFAHVWDNTCNACISEGMMNATGGSESTQYRLLGKMTYVGTRVYDPGGVAPTDYATTNRAEDWAESLRSFVYGTARLDGPRLDYVSALFPFRVR